MTSQAHELIKRLRAIRRAKELTQHQLAELAGYHRECISDMECLRNDPRFDKVVNVAEALGYKLELRKVAEV